MKGEAYIYKVNGSVEVKQLDASPDLKLLNDAVGGYIETVPYWTKHQNRRCVAFCNEEGKLNGLPYNAVADALWRGERTHHVDDRLVGNVIVLMGDDEFMEAI